MKVRLNDVDDIFYGDDDVDRIYLGEDLIWGGDDVPVLNLDPVYYDHYSWSPATTLTNLGTAGTNFDLTADGTGLARIRKFPGLLPGDSAYVEQREGIDPSVLGVPPRSRERMVLDYPYLYNNVSNLISVNNVGTDGIEGNIIAVSSSGYANSPSIKFPGVANNYLTVPDSAALDITTSIEITFRVAFLSPDNRLGNQRIVAKSGTSRGYEVWMGYDSNPHGALCFTRDGVSQATANIKAAALPETPMWFRVTYNSTTGQTKFYQAPNNGVEPSTWYQMGTTITTVTGAIVANADLLRIGTYNGSGDMFKGRLYNLIIRNADVSGTTVLNINVGTDCSAMTQDVTTTFTATSGQTVTLTKSGTPPNTVRYMPAFSDFTSARYGDGVIAGADFNELHHADGRLQLVWVRATVGTYDSTARTIFPVIRFSNGNSLGGISSLPYGNNSWGMYLDTFQAQMHMQVRMNNTDNFSELMTSGSGPITGTGDQVFFMATLRQGNQQQFWHAKYDATLGIFVYPSSGLYQPTFSFGAPLIDTSVFTNAHVEQWQGMTGFQITGTGIANFDGFVGPQEGVGWTGYDRDVREFIENQIKVVALSRTATYAVGEYWQATDDGTLEFAPEAVEEGDVLAVSSTAPTWQHIKLNHASRRKTLYRPRYVTFGEPADPISVTAPEDFFIWTVSSCSVDPQMDNYMAWGEDPTEDSFMDMEIYHYSGTDVAIYMELDDDAGNFGYYQRYPVSGYFTQGHSTPTLMAMVIDKGANEWRGYVYDANNGLTLATNDDDDAPTMTWNASTLTMSDVWFFGPEDGEGYNNSIIWGGGWTQGVGIAPTPDQVVDIWEQAVYGYLRS